MTLIERSRTDAPPVMQRAIEVGAALFSERGYGSTTTRDLAGALGMTNGTFYHYFPSKEQLLFAICRESLIRLNESVMNAIQGIPPSRELVAATIRAHVTTLLANEPLHTALLTEVRSLQGENLVEINELRDAYRNMLQKVIDDAKAAGALRAEWDSRLLMLSLLNLTNWTSRNRPDRPVDPESLANFLVELFLDGAVPR